VAIASTGMFKVEQVSCPKEKSPAHFLLVAHIDISMPASFLRRSPEDSRL